MKKSYLMIVAAAVLFAACSSNDLINDGPDNAQEKDSAIGFAAYSSKTTRADDENSTSLQKFYGTFDVYGWKTVNSSHSPVFSHVPVGYFATDGTGATQTPSTVVYESSGKPSDEWGSPFEVGWYYEDVRYWDRTATAYQFFAIAPYEAVPAPALTVSVGADNINIGSSSAKYDISTEKNLAIVSTKPIKDKKYFGFNKDYMLADKSTTQNAKVTFNFHHILTKFNVKITKQDTYTGSQALVVKDIKIANLAKNGYFEYSGMTTNGWKTSDTYSLQVTEDCSLNETINYSECYWIQTLIFPQDITCAAKGLKSNTDGLTNEYLYVKYSIGSEVFEAYYDLADVFDPAVAVGETYSFAQGSEYTLNLKIGPEPIKFDAQVTAWEVVADVNYSVN
ncbi:MAG TPA: fimbrillin family protein [Bacteroidales bacterium]|nr:fimbrillin family protein [Bacteroidales bacterium]